MALSDLFGGKKPQRRAASHFETRLGAHADALEPRRGALSNAVNLYIDDLRAGREGQRREMLGSAAADVAQAARGPVTSAADALDRAVARGRGLSRVLRATSGEFDSQLLRDRISAVQNARSRQSLGMGALSQAAGIQDGVNQAIQARRDTVRGLRANTMGTLLGIGAGLGINRKEFFGRKPLSTDGVPLEQANTGITYDISTQAPRPGLDA